MYSHYKLLISKFDIPEEVKTYLLEEADTIFSSYSNEFSQIIAKFYKVKNRAAFIESEMNDLSEKSDVNIYVLHFILLASASFYMLNDFKRANISEDIFWDTIRDLEYKLYECVNIKGYWGNFVYGWYNIFYTSDIFKLGRLEFERVKFDREYTNGDVIVKKGDTVYSVHIPSCGPLTKELREESYKKAYEFFKDELAGKAMVCICDSWLLYEKNKVIFPKNSNLLDFLNDWDIVSSKDDENFGDAWRVFGKSYEKGNMKHENSLQKSIINHIENGGTMGYGFGVKVIKDM